MKKCATRNCKTPSRVRGFCRSCYDKLHDAGKIKNFQIAPEPDGELLTEEESKRLHSKIQKTDTCWLWEGAVDRKGYGLTRIRRLRPSHLYAHRLMLAIDTGVDVFTKLNACHTCDNPQCVNPEHLFWGTQKENMLDSEQKGRTVKGEKNAQAKLTKDDVVWIHSQKDKGPVEIMRMLEKQRGKTVAHSQISRILKGTRWAHLHPGTAEVLRKL